MNSRYILKRYFTDGREQLIGNAPSIFRIASKARDALDSSTVNLDNIRSIKILDNAGMSVLSWEWNGSCFTQVV